MEPILEGFSRFIEKIDPYSFLCFGNDALDKILDIPALEFSKISQDHIIALFNTFFVTEGESATTNPFFSCQLLTHIAKTNSDLFSNSALLRRLFSLLNSSIDNHTSVGYTYQFFLPLFSRRSSILSEVFLEKSNIDCFLKNVTCSSICEMLKQFIFYYHDDSENLMCIFLDKICMDTPENKGYFTEILKGCINVSNIGLITRVFTAERTRKVFGLVQTTPNHALPIICALLALPNDSTVLYISHRIFSESLPKFSEIFHTSQNPTKILMNQAVTLALKSNLDLIYPQIFETHFVAISTVIPTQEAFFSNYWNSTLHYSYFKLIEEILRLRSNFLISSVSDI